MPQNHILLGRGGLDYIPQGETIYPGVENVFHFCIQICKHIYAYMQACRNINAIRCIGTVQASYMSVCMQT